ncbi:MAG: RNase adapter RapZ [Gammaproteobacteria bacterium]|nr:RNase adapter RapZ [Gammaproteobacteria bacterium]
MKLVIVSGMSGSGKSVALNVLEDQGYYCIDNLPLGLLQAFAEQLKTEPYARMDKFAIGIDARNMAEQLSNFPDVVDTLKSMGLEVEIFFLQAREGILHKRFSETRRKHPLSDDKTSLSEAIKYEQRLLEPVHRSADLLIDTSTTNIHQLRDIILERVVETAKGKMSILLLSFGFKHGIPSDADFVFDVRCLPNPHWIAELRPYTGRDQPVREYLEKSESVYNMFSQIKDFIEQWLPEFMADNRSYMTIALGCTGGQHRSVYLTERLAEALRGNYPELMLRHRELS